MAIQVIRSARANYSIETYLADKGQIFYEEETGDLRLANGTPGGLRILSGEADLQNYLNSVKGNIIPDQDDARDLGSPEKQWRDLYLAGNSLFLNGVRISAENNQLVLPPNTIIENQPVSNFSGDYNDLINRPDLSVYQLASDAFSGNYSDLTDKPSIPTNNNQLINGSGFITASALSGYATENFVTSRGYLTEISWNDILSKPEIPPFLSVGIIDSQGQLGSSITEVSALKFDSDSGFDITDLGDGSVKISMNSTFKTWKVDGQDDLIATGLDTIEFKAGQGITIETDPDSVPNKSITFSGFSGNYEDLSGKPSIPTDTNQLTNGAEYITVAALSGYATENYVDQSISAIVGSAPELLDTLKELSDALGGDENFANTVATSLAGKADIQDLSNAAFSGDYQDLLNRPSIPRDISDLTDNQGKLSADYTFNIAADDSTQREISNQETVKFIGSNGVSTSSDTEGNITIRGPDLSDVALSGDYRDLDNLPVIPQSLNDLTDVDTETSPPNFGQVLKFNGTKWSPAADIGSADSNGGTFTDASTLNGFDGSFYLNYNNLNNKPAPYNLPPATTETLGGVRIGENINVNNGVISVPKGAGINKVVDIPDVYDDNGLENKYILRYNSGATRWETEDLDLSNSTMDGGFY